MTSASMPDEGVQRRTPCSRWKCMCRLLRRLILLDRLKAADHCCIAELRKLSYNSQWDGTYYMPKVIHTTHPKQAESRERVILRNVLDHV